MNGKNAIVTGARTGIGYGVVEKFASLGINVWAIVHREDNEFLSRIQELSNRYNVWITPVYVDLSDEEHIKQGIQAIIKEKKPIDILVNAAGVLSPKRLFTMTSMADVRKLMDVNFFAVLQVTQLVSRVMMRQKSGSIVNISSMSAWGDDTAQLEYAVSKAAINCATKKMAKELGAYGVRVNAVAPGLIETKMLAEANEEDVANLVSDTSLKRIGKPQDVANLIAYLASEDASYVTGQIIRIDGGI